MKYPIEDAEKWLKKAIGLQKQGRLKEAEILLEKNIKTHGAHPDISYSLASVLIQTGQIKKAFEIIAKALESHPEHVGCLFLMGRILHQAGRLEDASNCYKKVLGIQKDNPLALNALGLIFKEQGMVREALRFIEKAKNVEPRAQYIWNNYGVILELNRREKEAQKAFEKALALDPAYFPARFNLGCLLFKLEDFKNAQKHLALVLKQQPDEPVAKFLMECLSKQSRVNRAPVDYVKKTFDDWANFFEEKLIKDLEYKTPYLVFSLVQNELKKDINILDLGCGTGLGAELYRPYAKRLYGIDCSEKMLKKAEEKGIFDRLILNDILDDFRLDTSFHLIYSTDCLCYFGDLKPVFAKIRSWLAANGVFAFSLEELKKPGEQYLLQLSGRFAHSQDYVIRCLSDLGFKLLDLKKEILRKEKGRAVHGLLVKARKIA